MSDILPVTRDAKKATIYKRLIAAKSSKSKNTGRAYAHDLADFASFLGIEPVGKAHPLASVPDNAWQNLDTAHVAAYLEHLQTAVSDKTGRPYSTATIARRITAVREFLTEAMWSGHFDREKLAYLQERLEPPQVSHEHHGGITADEQKRLLETADGQPGLKGLRDYALFRLWLDTGLRRAELAALQVRDLVTKDAVPTLIVLGKGKKTREVPLESYTAHVVKDWLKQSGQDADPGWPIFCQVRKQGRGDDAEYIAVNREKPLSGQALRQLVLWYCEQASIESEITPHSFRVAMITDARAGGANTKHIMTATGHTTSRMIDQVYDRNTYHEPVSRYRKTQLPRRAKNGDH